MSKEHAYAYEAGYRDGSVHYELEHCPACKNVADLQDALAENGRLRERITTQKQTIQAYRDESREWREVAERAQAENAKLRELCADMFNCISHANEQDWFYFKRDETGCGMSCMVNGEKCGLLALADRMRELGIEVGE